MPITGTKLPLATTSLKRPRPASPALATSPPAADRPAAKDGGDGLRGGARIAGQSHGVGKLRLQEVGPVGRAVLDEVLVDAEGHHAVVVAVPVALGVLGAVGDAVPGRNLVGLQKAFGLGGRTEAEADVDHVRRLIAGIALVGLDRLDLVAGAGVGIELVDLETILGLEALDNGAVAAPIMRQGDGGQLAFGLGGGDEFVQRCSEHGRGNAQDGLRGDCRREKQLERHDGSPVGRTLRHPDFPLFGNAP